MTPLPRTRSTVEPPDSGDMPRRPGGLVDRLRAHGWEGPDLRTDLLKRVAMANDASHYLLTPEAVVRPSTADAMAALLATASAARVPLTFRSGGTSLSGQAVTDGILVDSRVGFRGIEVLRDGREVRVEPGATVRAVNTALAPYGVKLGPDPASEAACTIGGVVANNSSGMTCGTHANPYATLRSLRFILPSGVLIDTAESDANERLRQLEPELYRGLLELRDRVREPELADRVRTLFAIKNTMGYAINAFLDFDAPTDILTHLLVGSEGTLGFVASATFETLPVLPAAGTGLLVLPDLEAATSVLPELIASGATVIELLDAQALRVAARDKHAPRVLRSLAVQHQAALLVEYQAATATDLATLVGAAQTGFYWTAQGGDLPTTDQATRAALWRIRKGLFAAVSGARRPGTTALLEDVAVPIEALPTTCAELTVLFDKYGYQDSVIFGHAKDGNIHFMLNEEFGDAAGVDRYAAFTEDMVDLILGHRGTLKAEHGTGRVMASFLRRQYGDELYDVMVAVKRLCDPHDVLNPGVLLSDRPTVHLENLKTTLPIEAEADRCVECGFCEPVCPSRDLTLTPRQRIVVKRAMAAADAAGETESLQELNSDYAYEGIQTCAADGMCQTSCPVDIDTGSLVRRLRAENHGAIAKATGRVAARHWAGATAVASAAMTLARRAPAATARLSRAARALTSDELVPQWTADLPRGGDPRGSGARSDLADVVYFPSCTSSMFEPASGRPLMRTFESLCGKAGVRVAVPDGIDSLCCGMPWSSKGLTAGAGVMSDRLRETLWAATGKGRLGVVVDSSSCAESMVKSLRKAGIRVEDATDFVVREVLSNLVVEKSDEVIAVHPTCSSVRMGTDAALHAIVAALSRRPYVPPSWGCCGFAGDRGLLHPELTESATRDQAAEVVAAGATTHVSCNRTCELGMTRAVGQPYEHVLEVLDARSAGRRLTGDLR